MAKRQMLSMVFLAAWLCFFAALPAVAETTDVLAVVDGQEITASDIESRIKGQLLKLHNELYSVKRQAVEALIAERLLNQEATKRGITPQQLVQQEPAQLLAAIHRIGFRASLWSAPASQRFQGQGTVIAVDRQRGTVTLDHDEIKGLMPPMVMTFTVDAREVLQGLRPGDTVTFTLLPRGLTFTIADMTVVKP